MNLSTSYLGLKLSHPFMAGASPMPAQLDIVKRLEDGGVRPSCFTPSSKSKSPWRSRGESSTVIPFERANYIRVLQSWKV